MILLVVLITLMVANKINDILSNVKKKNELQQIQTQSNDNTITKIEASSKQLQFIDFTVLSVLQIRVSNSLILNQPLKMQNIDMEVKSLSQSVLNSLKRDFFKNPQSLYTTEFLMKYMIDKCKLSLIDAIRQSHPSDE